MMGLAGALAPRLAQTLVTVFGASLLIWALLPLSPGDPAERILRARGVAEPLPAEIEAAREEFGLDQPLYERYLTWVWGLLRGDLSDSFVTGKPVRDDLAQRWPATALLASVALGMGLVLAVGAALTAAAFRDRWPDAVIRGITLILAGLPGYVLGLLMLQFLVVKFSIGSALADGTLRDAWMPGLCLALSVVPLWSRLLRANVIEAMNSQYAFMAEARGASRVRIVFRHALPNAASPFITLVAIGTAGLLGGAAIIETVFTWPGIGLYVVRAIGSRDLPVVQAVAIIGTATYVVSSLVADLLVTVIDPRARKGRAS